MTLSGGRIEDRPMRTYQKTLLLLLVAGVPYAEADTIAREVAGEQ